VVGRASALLSRRGLALAALLAVVAAYSALAGHLWSSGLWPQIAFLALVVLPVTLALPYLALPAARERGLLLVAVALGVLSVLFHLAGMGVAFDLAKLGALTATGFWFLAYFEALSWVVLVAAIVPWVDIVSVWRGPTDYIVEEKPGLFEQLAVGFRVPGEEGAAHLGPPDILFFALFLAAAARFGLRPFWTWFSMTALLGATLALAAGFDISGLPALPALCLGFLLPNADLIWRGLRLGRREAG
jgi:hypothetical protein